MSASRKTQATVYTETIIHSPPAQYAADAPYQLAIVEHADGTRQTVRILGQQQGDRVQIGDRVLLAEERDGVSYYRKAGAADADGPAPPA